MPPKKPSEVTELFVYLADGAEGEGIVSAFVQGTALPLIAGNESLALQMKTLARKSAELRGKRVKLVKFSNREVIEDL